MTDIPASGYAVILLPDGPRKRPAAWGPMSAEAARALAAFTTAEVDPGAVVVPLMDPAGAVLAWWEHVRPLVDAAVAASGRPAARPATPPAAGHRHTYADRAGGGLYCTGCPVTWSAELPGGRGGTAFASGNSAAPGGGGGGSSHPGASGGSGPGGGGSGAR